MNDIVKKIHHYLKKYGFMNRIFLRSRKIRRELNANYINPKDLIQTLSVEELCDTAEKYYKSIANPTQQMAKPFSGISEASDILQKLSVLISGLKLGQTMTVLDFGAGTCWLSRLLHQMQCSTISMDASQTALDIGKRLFHECPVIGGSLQEPKFIHFTGHTIDIENESVDRIICFDMFHHIPNQSEILAEFYRVLKPGGIVGFSEPGPNHSQSPQSQYEMKNYHVLENDIVLGDIKKIAEIVGYSQLYLRLSSQPDLELDFADYRTIISGGKMPSKIHNHLVSSMENSTVYFLVKGTYQPDSRSNVGLRHSITAPTKRYRTRMNEPIKLDLTVSNIGSATWLHQNINDIGVVMLGVHLYDSHHELIDLDYFRSPFEVDVKSGQRFDKQVLIPSPNKKGLYYLSLDLVSERICWFENMGSTPQNIEVFVE